MALEVSGQEQEAGWPGLSKKERDRRWGRAKEMMRAEGLECLVVFGLKGRDQFDRYLTNDRTGGIVIFPLEGELAYLSWTTSDVVSHLESALRGEESWVRDIRRGTTGAGVVGVLRERGYERANIGVVGLDSWAPAQLEGYVPYRTWAYISDNLPHANFRDVSLAFAKLVLVKSEDELQIMRRAAEIGELAAEAMMKATRPGVSENVIYAATVNQLFLNGANGGISPHTTPMIMHSGADNMSWGAPMWLLRGQPPRVVKNGDLVQAEIFSRYGGMEAQLQMSVAIEPVDPVNRECAEIARRVYEVGLKALRPGKTFGEVVEAMEAVLTQAGAWHSTPLIHSLSPLSWVSGAAAGIEKIPGID